MISVVIPAYNREKTIKRAIDSVLMQTYTDIEVIVVDDCSSDNTEHVVKNYHDNRVHYIRHATNQGACVARNTGIENAHGAYIAFQDSDDSWRPEKLEKQLESLNVNHADICFCRMERHNYPGKKERLYPNLESGIVDYETLLLRSLASTQTIIAKREVCMRHRFDPAIKRMQDYDWMIRAAQEYSVCYVSDVLVDLYLQDDSITSFDYAKLCEINQVFLNKYASLCDKYPEFYIKRMDRIAYYKTIMGQNGTHEYYEIYKKNRGGRAFAKYIAAKTGVLRMYYKMRNR